MTGVTVVSGAQPLPTRVVGHPRATTGRKLGRKAPPLSSAVSTAPLPGQNPYQPPVTDNLALYLAAGEVSGSGSNTVEDGTPLAEWVDLSGNEDAYNLLTVNQATVETDTTGLSGFGTGTLSRSSEFAASGDFSLKIVANGGNVSFGPVNTAPHRVPVTPGKTYTGFGKLRGAAATDRSTLIIIAWMNSAGVSVGDNAAAGAIVVDQWQELSVTAVAPAGAAYAYVFLRVTAAIAGQEFFGDEFGFWEGTRTDWHIPLPNEHLPRNAVQGTPANQPLFRRANPNLLTYNQATAATDATGWSGLGTITRSTTSSPYGPACFEGTETGPGASTRSVYGGFVPCLPGQRVKVFGSFQTPAGSPARNLSLRAIYYDDSNVYQGEAGFEIAAASIPAGGAWFTAVSPLFAAAPVGTTQARLAFYIRNCETGDIVRWGAMGITVDDDIPVWVPPVTLPNGKPVVQFSTLQTMDSLIDSDRPITVYWVNYADALGSGIGYPSAAWQPSAAGVYRNASSGSCYVHCGSAVYAPGVVPTNAWTVLAGVIQQDGTDSRAYANGAAGTAGPAGAGVTNGALRLAAGAASVAAVLVYDTAHDDTTRQQVEAWLMGLYNI